ncbi:DUF5686 and carboxypeptidase-like regulatory domain-containing protein [Sanyastnella coralliicola]|uniref:DUF5686 and carboxypeptidase-like regulatory domain-containing protein n=1 Tax=Sanyastnella coralliicola TaxID=3069118 RepID=UPI0027BAA60C|nr:DUF5686 and carboxypeptidase-like regulatory domain-containing protein [Longitalea sp. SCSIO 12813]
MALSSFAQKTVVSGKVTDAETGEALPYVNISFVGTKSGTITDFNGNYFLETYYASDSIRASFIGYKPSTKAVKLDQTQVINFELSVSSIALEVAEVTAGDEENPAHPIIRAVQKNRKINNREKLEAYEYELYNKVEFDLNNLTDEFRERKIMKPFEFVFDNIDSTEEKIYLPIFMTENISEFYYRKNPKTEKEIILATKISGIENKSVSQFLGDMYQNVNIYDNNIIVFGKSFVSPISGLGFTFYDYYLMDSTYIEGKWCYQIKFQPKRKQELTFTGDMWVNDTTYAVKQVEATIAEDANINFINKLKVRQEYNEVQKEVWMLTRDELLVDFNLTEKTMGFYGRKTTTYRDFQINEAREDDFYKGISDIIVEENATEQGEEFWDDRRHIELTDNEKSVYQMVDSIKTVPQFRTIADVISLFVSGYYVRGNFEYGPYFTLYSFNPVEGHRFRVGGRTSNDFSKRVLIEGYTAYGLRDRRFKYGGGITWMLSKQPRMVFGISGKEDVEQLGQAPGAFQQDNVLSSIFRRNPANKLTNVVEAKSYFEREWFYGLSNKIVFTHRTLSPLGALRYERLNDIRQIEPVDNLTTAELTFYTRFAYKEKFLSGEFDRVSLGTKYPTLEVAYTLGLKDVINSDYEYQKLVVRVKDKVRFGPLGYARIWAEAGRYWGQLPYPLLQLHQGNETFFYDETAFNTMNFFEFVSDEWVSASITYHADGLFLNRIPLMRKLKWREVATVKGVVGNFDPSNQEEMVLPPETNVLTKPYVEAALGVENIFKFLRVDGLWRLSYLDNPNIVKFGIRAKFQFDF